ncbi:class I SAM-dependent methyltransferase [Candidatus Omnitrophota bacterium]
MEEEYRNRYLDSVRCNLCGSAEYRVIYESTLTEDDLKGGAGQYSISTKACAYGQIVRCSECGLVYMNPREKPGDMLGKYTAVKDEDYLTEKEMRQDAFARELKRIEKYASHKGRLLEVGCFVGLFLELARSNGWSVSGVEPSAWAVQYAREKLGISVAQAPVEEYRFDDTAFDVVTMWDVVEHLADPKKALASVCKSLKKQGILFLNTPDFNSIIRRIFGRKCWFVLRTHIYYFTPRTIKRMLEECGFEVVVIGRHFKTLSLSYFALRFREVNVFAAGVLGAISRAPLLKNVKITVYAGQMSIIARKKD